MKNTKEINTENWAIVFSNEEARELFGNAREYAPGEFIDIPEEGPLGWGRQVPLKRDVSYLFEIIPGTEDHRGVHFKNGRKICRQVEKWIDKAQGDGYFVFYVE